MIPRCQENLLSIEKRNRTQTDTGRLVENTKALERKHVKELCKLTPYPWKKEYPKSVKPLRVELNRVAVKGPRRLFSKNIALCQLARGSIGCDACPVPEG